MIPKETIDLIFETARVEEVIGDFVSLKKAGQNYKGLSPFVTEKTPSFVVSPVKQIWKDFSTGKGGNVVGFMMELESYSYPEALRYLAKRYNIEIEERKLDEEDQRKADAKESMYLVSEYAATYFNETINNSQKGRAIGLSYFKERGFTQETIDKFRLGYSLDEWTAFSDAAISKGYKLEFLDKTGLTIVKENGKKFDRFKGRVMFPIQSMSGRVLGFGGRTLITDKKAAKYLNSPESEIYHKSDVLYGIYQAKSSIIKKDNCYLVEGYTDVISLNQNGIENVVASSGTALTAGQINLIKRFTPNITVLYDGDAAGIKASFRGIDLILEQGMNVKVLTFPDGHDPDSYARLISTSEMQEYLNNNSTDFIKFKTNILLGDAKNDPIKKAGLIRDIVNSISRIDDKIKRNVYVQETSRLLDIQEDILFDELAQIDSREQQKKFEQSKRKNYNQQTSERNTSNTGNTHNTSNTSNIQPTQNPGLVIVPDEPMPEIPGMPTNNNTNNTKDSNLDKKVIAAHQEKDLMDLLLAYGAFKIILIDEYEEEAEDGTLEKKEESIETTVTQEIVDRLQEDDLNFDNELFSEIFNEIIEGLKEDEIRTSKYFTRHQNLQINSFVANAETEKYELSENWIKKDIIVKKKEDRLSQITEETILRFKERIIFNKIDKAGKDVIKINDNIERQNKMKYLIELNQLRNLINAKLNRIL